MIYKSSRDDNKVFSINIAQAEFFFVSEVLVTPKSLSIIIAHAA